MDLSDYSDYETVLIRAKYFYGDNVVYGDNIYHQQEKQKSI